MSELPLHARDRREMRSRELGCREVATRAPSFLSASSRQNMRGSHAIHQHREDEDGLWADAEDEKVQEKRWAHEKQERKSSRASREPTLDEFLQIFGVVGKEEQFWWAQREHAILRTAHRTNFARFPKGAARN